MFSNWTESEERTKARWTRQGLTPPEPTNRELIESITANINECIAMMDAANDMQTRDAGALKALDIIRDNANAIPNSVKVQITKRLTQALDDRNPEWKAAHDMNDPRNQLATKAQRQAFSAGRLSTVKIDGRAGKPLTTVQYISRAWLVWAGVILFVSWLLSLVIR